MRWRALPLRAHKACRVAVIDHHQRFVFLGQFGDFGQFRQIAVHAEHTVGGDHDKPRAFLAGELELTFKVVHVRVGIAVAFGFAQADAVDDRGVVQTVRDDGVLWPEQGLEQPAVGIKASRKQDRIVFPEEGRQLLFQLAVDVLCATDKADRGHAEPLGVHRVTGRGDEIGVVCQPQVVVCAKIDHLTPAHRDLTGLGRGDHALLLHHTVRGDAGQGGVDVI